MTTTVYFFESTELAREEENFMVRRVLQFTEEISSYDKMEITQLLSLHNEIAEIRKLWINGEFKW